MRKVLVTTVCVLVCGLVGLLTNTYIGGVEGVVLASNLGLGIGAYLAIYFHEYDQQRGR